MEKIVVLTLFSFIIISFQPTIAFHKISKYKSPNGELIIEEYRSDNLNYNSIKRNPQFHRGNQTVFEQWVNNWKRRFNEFKHHFDSKPKRKNKLIPKNDNKKPSKTPNENESKLYKDEDLTGILNKWIDENSRGHYDFEPFESFFEILTPPTIIQSTPKILKDKQLYTQII